MQDAHNVVAYIMEAIALASQHGGAQGEEHVSMTTFRQAGIEGEGFTLKFGSGPGAPLYRVTVERR